MFILLNLSQSNVGSVMEQLDTLAQLKERFEEDVERQGQDPTIRLEAAIKGNSLPSYKFVCSVIFHTNLMIGF